jgi:hypothetical protein
MLCIRLERRFIRESLGLETCDEKMWTEIGGEMREVETGYVPIILLGMQSRLLLLLPWRRCANGSV